MMSLKTKTLVAILFITAAHSIILQPSTFQDKIFTSEITGDLTPIQPTNYAVSKYWPLPIEIYQISMRRTKHQFLPQGFPSTEVFAYAKKVNGKFVGQYPGPYIQAFKGLPTYVRWSNNIKGQHILPVDKTPPFDMLEGFFDQVPTVPHAHGLQSQPGSDGQAMGFWTRSGRKGHDYFSLSSNKKYKNQAIFRYHNTKQGLFWYHDHTMGITRLNVYAGLVGYYEIIDPEISIEQKNILKYYGDLQRKHFIIADKTFNTDGSLYYPDTSPSSNYTSWVPEFFGNTITVNGVVWPKVNLKAEKYRFVFLNGCQSRFLNIYFQNNGKKLEFQVFRRDSDYLQKPITMTQLPLLVAGRIQIFIDLTDVQGQVIIKNDEVPPAPPVPPVKPFHSNSHHMKPTSDNYTSQILKINIDCSSDSKYQKSQNTNIKAIKNKINLYYKRQYQIMSRKTFDFIDEPQQIKHKKGYNFKNNYKYQKITSANDYASCYEQTGIARILINNKFPCKDPIITIKKNIKSLLSLLNNYQANLRIGRKKGIINNAPYPRFEQGIPFFTVLTEINNQLGEPYSLMIDGVPLTKECQGSVYKQGQVYEFFIINLTPDNHPMHIHLVNFQVIGRFQFDFDAYKIQWENKNGVLQPGGYDHIPQQVDVRDFGTSALQPPADFEKQFLDVINVPAFKVTIARVKFANHYGKPFPFDVTTGKYLWHCHILEHQDNQMMRYFCVE